VSSVYVMESEAEAERLVAQERAFPSTPRLELTGLRPGAAVVDVGCGPGVVAESMLERVGPGGRLVAVDPHAGRLAVAARRLARYPNAQALQAALPETGLEGGQFDYVWCQFVFQYLQDPLAGLSELVRLARPGGKVVVGDVDGLGLNMWPLPEDLLQDAQRMIQAVTAKGVDMFVGRKLYSLFRRSGLQQVKVHVTPLYVVAGAPSEQFLQDWRLRFEALKPVAAPAFGGEESYRQFCERSLSALGSEESFKYTLVVTAEGLKP
jgi:ubiquinone/menaquinone biosynthesis C-methylase UbiE